MNTKLPSLSINSLWTDLIIKNHNRIRTFTIANQLSLPPLPHIQLSFPSSSCPSVYDKNQSHGQLTAMGCIENEDAISCSAPPTSTSTTSHSRASHTGEENKITRTRSWKSSATIWSHGFSTPHHLGGGWN